MEEEKKEYIMTKKEAQNIIEVSQKIAHKTSVYFNDCVVKSSLYMKDRIDKDIEVYSKIRIKGVSKEAQEEIIKILNFVKIMITTQCDIVFNKENAKTFNYEPFTVEDLMQGEHLGFGFGSYFDGNI